MYFTKEDLEKIRKYIAQYGVKDSEFDEQYSVGKKDWFTIVGADGLNKRVNAGIIVDLIRSLWKESGQEEGISFYGNRLTLSTTSSNTAVELTLQIFDNLKDTDSVRIYLYKNNEAVAGFPKDLAGSTFTHNGKWAYNDLISEETLYEIVVSVNEGDERHAQWRVEKGGVTLSQDFGNSTIVGISQKRLSDTLDLIWGILFNSNLLPIAFSSNVQQFIVGNQTTVNLTLALPIPAVELIIKDPNGGVISRGTDVSALSGTYTIGSDVFTNQQFTAYVRMANAPKTLSLTVNADLPITSFTVSPQSVYVGESTAININVTATKSMSMQISATLGNQTYSVQNLTETDSISTTYTIEPAITGTLAFTLTASYQGLQVTLTKNVQVKQRDYPYMYYGNSHNASPSEQEIKGMQSTRQSSVNNLLYNSTYFYIAVHSSKNLSAVYNVTDLGPDNITEDVELVNNSFTITTSGPSQTYKLYRIKFNEDIAQYNQFDDYSLQITIS